MTTKIIGTLIVFCCVSAPAFAQQRPGPIAPAEKPADGQWDEIDRRLVFLMVRLANVEASLDAVEDAIGKNTGKRSSNLSAAKRAEAGNERMDRQGGGPMKWSEFYGRTAERFFYHPTDRNTTYHTTTLLRQNGPEADNKVSGGVPAGQGLPVHQRPPQFDYIYRANRDAQAKAERDAAELRNKVDELLARRSTLEAEQSALWCEVAFRAVSRYDLARKPLYRFEPVAASIESADQERAEALKAAAIFMRLALSIVAEAQKDQGRAFGNIKTVVADAREKLDDNWIRQAVLASDMTDLRTPPGKVVVLAKQLDDVSSNLSESYEVSIDGDRFKDEQRKDTFRGLLQESLVSYAQIVLALDEMTVLMASEWKIKPDLARPYQMVSLPQSAPSFDRSRVASPAPAAMSSNQSLVSGLQGEWLVVAEETNGEVYPRDRVTEINRRIRINDNSLTMSRTMNGKFGAYEGHFEVDFTNGHFDWSGKGPNQANVQWIGVFDLNGDQLRLCYKYVKSGTTRPTTFRTAVPTQPGEAFVNLTLSRQAAPASKQSGDNGVLEAGNVALQSRGTRASGMSQNPTPDALIDGIVDQRPPVQTDIRNPWTITFAKVYRLRRIKMQIWFERGRLYKYKIDASPDGTTFKPLIEEEGNGWQVLDFSAQPIKAIRITPLGDSKNPNGRPYLHVHEIEAYCKP